MKKLTCILLFFFLLTSLNFLCCKLPTDSELNDDPLNPEVPEVPEDEKSSIEGACRIMSYDLQTQNPNIVRILFGVQNLTNPVVIDDLQTTDLILYEDGVTISDESFYYLSKVDEDQDITIKTVILLDNSSSVGGNLIQIKDSAKAIVDGIAEYQEIAIYSFSEALEMNCDFTNDITTLKNAIDGISSGYVSTNLYGSISQCLELWEDQVSEENISIGNLVVFTDGSDTTGEITLDQLLNNRDRKNIFGIGTGNINTETMNQISNAGFYEAANYEDLSSLFIKVQESIIRFSKSFYWIEYMSPKRGDSQHSISAYIKNNQNYDSDNHFINYYFSSDFYSVTPSLYINDTGFNPNGAKTLYSPSNATIDVIVNNYYTNDIPEYTFTSEDASICSFSSAMIGPIRTIATFNINGDRNDVCNISINDSNNNRNLTIPIEIRDWQKKSISSGETLPSSVESFTNAGNSKILLMESDYTNDVFHPWEINLGNYTFTKYDSTGGNPSEYHLFGGYIGNNKVFFQKARMLSYTSTYYYTYDLLSHTFSGGSNDSSNYDWSYSAYCYLEENKALQYGGQYDIQTGRRVTGATKVIDVALGTQTTVASPNVDCKFSTIAYGGNKQVVATGGIDYYNDWVDELMIYDGNSDSWTLKEDFIPNLNFGHEVVYLSEAGDSKVAFYGGVERGKIPTKIWIYDVGKNSFSLFQSNNTSLNNISIFYRLCYGGNQHIYAYNTTTKELWEW